MKINYTILLVIFVVSLINCQNKEENKSSIYSIQLIKRSKYNDDMLISCFEVSNSLSFNERMKKYRITKINYPTIETWKLNFYYWKIQKYNLKTNTFMVAFLIPNGRITRMSNDSISLIENRLILESEMDIIFENEDTVHLNTKEYEKLNPKLTNFSPIDTNWVGMPD